ncbi:hypothetical protein ACF09I_35540 [Streptomyces sp. NPDC014940]|uniref:hypothetical protein n=1 Tax=Streptomyces sp. NPDC014940 TaxID=3364932 RepID=UPI0036FF1987
MTNSLPQEPGQPSQGWVFSAGEWTKMEDPVMNQPEDESDVEELIKSAGYRSWTQAGSALAVPLTLAVWARAEEPSFLFDLDGVDHSEWFYAATLPDALVLLNQLAPTLQALTITEQVAQADPKSMSVLGDVLDKLHGRRRDVGGRLISD